LKTQFIYVIRHGETKENKDGVYQGRTIESSINETGKIQSKLLGKFMKAFENYFPLPFIIFSSSATRALQTGAAVEYSMFGSHRLELVSMPELQEIDHGEWEGRRHADIQAAYPELYKLWLEHPMAMCFPGGESSKNAESRVLSGLKKILEGTDGNILIVGHVITNLFVLCNLLKNPKMIRGVRQHNTCLNVIERNGNEFKDIMLNSTAHLLTPPEAQK